MLKLPGAVRVYFCMEATDMRKSFDGLAGMVSNIVKQNPVSGHLFLFRNRRGNCVKLLYWDGDGFAIWYKRLEKGTFSVPNIESDGSIDPRDLSMMLEGVDFTKVRKRRRYKLGQNNF